MDPSKLLQRGTHKSSQSIIDSSPSLRAQRRHEVVTFRQCFEQVGRDGQYQHKVFILMTIFWVSASLFLSYPFYLFQKAHYFLNTANVPCLQYDDICIDKVCDLYYPKQILDHVIYEYTLTYEFKLFCAEKSKKVFYKCAITALAIIGFISYGMIADQKGRKVAMKISWRFYTIGVLIFCATQTQLLVVFGYFIASINCYPFLILQFIQMFQTTNSQMRLVSFLRILASGFIGNLLSTLISEYILSSLGYIRLVVFLTVGLPALVLCFFLEYIEESPKFYYKNSKLKAFNSLNRIAKKNNREPIWIDLTSSQWVKLQNYKISFTQIFKMHQLRERIITLFVLFLINFFNTKTAQIGMDLYTESDFRGILINGATSLAFFTLILTKLQIKITHLMIFNIIFNFTYFILIYMVSLDQQTKNVSVNYLIITILVLIRFIAQMTYGRLLIVSIQNCPTIIRGQGLGFIMASMSIAEAAARALTGYEKIVSVINLFGVLFSLIIEFKRNSNRNNDGKMPDTVKGYYYDENDKFVRIYKIDNKIRERSYNVLQKK